MREQKIHFGTLEADKRLFAFDLDENNIKTFKKAYDVVDIDKRLVKLLLKYNVKFYYRKFVFLFDDGTNFYTIYKRRLKKVCFKSFLDKSGTSVEIHKYSNSHILYELYFRSKNRKFITKFKLLS